MTSPVTARDRAKAERSDAILHAAARLFAERGRREAFSQLPRE